MPPGSTGSPGSLKPVRLVRAAIADPQGVARRVADPEWLAGATVLKRDPDSVVWLGRLDARDIIVKRLTLRGVSGLVKRLAGRTRGMRQWHGAEALAGAGIDAAEPFLLFRTRGDNPGETHEYLLMERTPGEPLINIIAGRTGHPPMLREQHDLASAAGELVVRMMMAGLYNRDIKPSNLMARRDPGAPRGWRLVQIDTVGIRPMSRGDEGRRMVFRLLVEPLGLKCPPRMALRWRVVRAVVGASHISDPRDAARRLWREVERVRQSHGDPTPKVSPFAGVPTHPNPSGPA